MASKSDKYLLFLLCAVTLADARPNLGAGPALSVDKQLRLDELLQSRFADLSAAERRALLRRALEGMPPLRDGLGFLRFVEKSSQRLAAELDSPKKAYAVLKRLVDLAAADGVSDPEWRVLQAAAANLGLKEHVVLRRTAEGAELDRVGAGA